MVSIETKEYHLEPSDSKDWIFVSSPDGLKVDVEVAVLDYLYTCQPKEIEVDGHRIFCSRLCCYAGCYVSLEEIEQIEVLLPEMLPDLQKDSQNLLKYSENRLHNPADYDEEEEVYKIRCAPQEWDYDDDHRIDEENSERSNEKTDDEDNSSDEFILPPKNHCIFLMEDGLCAMHKYYNEIGQNWLKHKFNICTTFPLDLRVPDRTIAFMKEFDNFAFADVECLSPDQEMKKKLGYPQIVDAMRDVIADRFGAPFWKALTKFAQDFRTGLIVIDHIYSDVDL
ncbi:MAG: hypothetical protein E4G98_05760 [Promethearchaeota archaeon]|nr:MAG: hypothetical protein E4G98_05760 [Candidatus Lokiarchaeota archaeon]